ncbi:hypothetical protein JCM8202_005981 [Rhodotorula sphaerocarpa]
MSAPTASTATTKRPRVAFLGPLGTYSHQAAHEFFGDECVDVPQERIADVFSAVAASRATYGVVPIENSSFGPVAETTEQLRTSELALRGMVRLSIGHTLLANREVEVGPEGKRAPRRVYSHEQAIGQCRQYLQTHYPDVQIVPVNSTARAAQEASRDLAGLAICSAQCAQVYDLQVLDREIQDAGAANTTRFVVLALSSTPLPAEYPVRPAPTAAAAADAAARSSAAADVATR